MSDAIMPQPAHRVGRRGEQRRIQWSAYLFIAPFLGLYCWLLVYPLVYGMVMSFHYNDLLTGFSKFVGWENYVQLFDDPLFRRAILNTFLFVIMTVPVFVAAGLLIALAANRNTRGGTILRVLFFGPHVLSVTVVTLIWKTVYLPNVGMLDSAASSLGLDPPTVLQNPKLAMAAIALVTVWWAVGLPMMLFIAALQQIPGDIYEAAKLDSAGRRRIFWTITIPQIRHMIVLVAIIEIVLQFQVFGQIHLLTGGGPNNATRPLVMMIYELGFKEWSVGYAAAASEVLFVIMLVAATLQFLASRRKEHHG